MVISKKKPSQAQVIQTKISMRLISECTNAMQTFVNTNIKAKTFQETLMTGMQSGYGLSYR